MRYDDLWYTQILKGHVKLSKENFYDLLLRQKVL